MKALSPAPEPQTVSSDMKAIYDFLSQKVDVHGACLAPELIEQFVEVVTPFADYAYRWKLNTGCKKSKEERADLMAVSESPSSPSPSTLKLPSVTGKPTRCPTSSAVQRGPT